MRIGVGLSIPELATRGGKFSPASLFSGGVQGAWYAPDDFSTLFQDSAGATPVTAVEQPVRLMLDKSQGLVLGSELVTNGDFATDTNWTKGSGWGIAGGKASITSAVGTPILEQSVGFSTGTFYKVIFTILDRTAGDIILRLGGGTNAGTFSTNGTFERIFAASGTGNLQLIATNGSTLSVDNVSVKALPGNHALAPNDASRPVLRARYNLLTYSEQFDNAVWNSTGLLAFGSGSVVNATTAPDGTTTADLIVESGVGAGSIQHYVNTAFGTPVIVSGATYVASAYVKSAGRNIVYIQVGAAGTGYGGAFITLSGGGTVSNYFNGLSSGITVTALTNNWYRISITFVAANTNGAVIVGMAQTAGTQAYTGDGTSGIYIWGADLRTGSSAGTYQRIAAATDYDTAGFLPYLAFDGTDDSFGTNSINFTGTDKMFACAGLTKLNTTAAFNCLLELGATSANGISIFAPDSNNNNYSFWLKTQSRPTATSVYVAPITNVISVQHDCAEATAALQTKPRINGASVSIATSTAASAGNFANEAMFIGRRNNASLPFNGRIYQMVVCGKTLSAAELASTEAYVATKTGVTL